MHWLLFFHQIAITGDQIAITGVFENQKRPKNNRSTLKYEFR